MTTTYDVRVWKTEESKEAGHKLQGPMGCRRNGLQEAFPD
jgi:hypothetical protein